MGINFQKFKQGQNFDTTTEVNLSKNAKMGKQLWMGQFWPKILFFSWVPSFGSYIDDQNLNGPLGLKRADSGCPCPYGPQQPESPCFRFFFINMRPKLRHSRKKIRFLGKIGWSIVVFPFWRDVRIFLVISLSTIEYTKNPFNLPQKLFTFWHFAMVYPV